MWLYRGGESRTNRVVKQPLAWWWGRWRRREVVALCKGGGSGIDSGVPLELAQVGLVELTICILK